MNYNNAATWKELFFIIYSPEFNFLHFLSCPVDCSLGEYLHFAFEYTGIQWRLDFFTILKWIKKNIHDKTQDFLCSPVFVRSAAILEW